MEFADVLNGAPAPISATSLDPYGQLVKMLLPRAQSIAIYDRMGVARLGSATASTTRELHRLVQETPSRELTTGASRGRLRRAPGRRAVGLRVRASRHFRGIARRRRHLISRERAAEPRPYSLVQGLLRPAIECLERELASQYSIGDLQRNLIVRDRDLELLLGAAHDEAASARFHRRFRHGWCRVAWIISGAASARC